MFSFLRMFNILKKGNEKKDDLSISQFKKLSKEIRELAKLIEKVWITNGKFLKRIKRIQKEMDQLDRILEKKYFSILPDKKKEELKKTLIFSREELLKCIEEAPCPTERKQ